jgi:hypothetical protein
VADAVIKAPAGFDHGVGHPLLLLCDAKAPNCRKNKAFKDLGHYSEWPKVADAVIEAAAGIQGHINDLSLDLRRLPGVGIREEKRASVIRARPAPIPLLVLPCRAMSHNIRAVTVRTV